MKKKIVYTVLLGILICLCIYGCIEFFRYAASYIKTINYYKINHPEMWEDNKNLFITATIKDFIFAFTFLGCIVFQIYGVIYLWKKDFEKANIKEKVTYTYQDYIKEKEAKEIAKKEKRIKELQKELEELNK